MVLSPPSELNFQRWPLSDRRLLDLLDKFGAYPIQSIWRKTDKSIFGSEYGVIAVEESWNCFVVCGDPLTDGRLSPGELLDAFVLWGESHGKTVCGYYFSEETAHVSKLQRKFMSGVSRGLNLNRFSLQGYGSRDFRRAINSGERAHLEVFEVPHGKKPLYFNELKRLELDWIRQKSGPKIHFILNRLKLDFLGSEEERWFLVRDSEQRIHAFLTTIALGRSGGIIYVDQLVQVPQAHKLGLDYLLAKVGQVLKKEGSSSLWLGLCVFRKITGRSCLERVFQLLGRWNWLYSSLGLYIFKKKYTDTELPRYLLLSPRKNQIRQILALTKVTYPQFFLKPVLK